MGWFRWLSRKLDVIDPPTDATEPKERPRWMLESDNNVLSRLLQSAENREGLLKTELNTVDQYASMLHEMAFPGVELPAETIGTLEGVHRWMSAQSRELESLRSAIVESSTVKESIERTQEIVTELRDKMIAGDAITFPEPAANKLDELVREFIDLANTPEPQPNRGLTVSRMHFRQWAERLKSAFTPPVVRFTGVDHAAHSLSE